MTDMEDATFTATLLRVFPSLICNPFQSYKKNTNIPFNKTRYFTTDHKRLCSWLAYVLNLCFSVECVPATSDSCQCRLCRKLCERCCVWSVVMTSFTNQVRCQVAGTNLFINKAAVATRCISSVLYRMKLLSLQTCKRRLTKSFDPVMTSAPHWGIQKKFSTG